MGKLVVTEFVSLDGVMEAPGGEDFKYPGWSFAFDRGDDGNRFKLDETLETDALLIGRVTYESFAGAWPKREGEFADKFNTMPKYVVSSTLEDPEWNNTTVLKGDVVDEATKLKEQIDGIVQTPGSLRLVQTLLDHDLVDELHLMVFPVILGTGRRLFGSIQFDPIDVAGRTHDLMLHARVAGYDPAWCHELYERREIFEAYNKGLSFVLASEFPWFRARLRANPPRVIAENPEVAGRVIERIRAEGPLSSRDFESERGSTTDW